MKFKLGLFGGLLIVALIVFGYFADTLLYPHPIDFHKVYATLDFELYAPTNGVCNLSQASQDDVIPDLLIAADSFLIGRGTQISYTNAVACFSKVLSKDAQNPRALMGMAICYYTGKGVQKDWDKAADLGWSALVAASKRQNDAYVSVQQNPFALLLRALVSSRIDGNADFTWIHDKIKEPTSSSTLPLPPALWPFALLVVFIVYCFVKPNFLVAPWQVKLMKLLESIATVIILVLAFDCNCFGCVFVTASVWMLWFIMRDWKFGFPFCVIGFWLCHLKCLCQISFLDFSVAWNSIPLFCRADYGNVPLEHGYMSVHFPEIFSGINAAYLYVALLVCAILIYVLNIVRRCVKNEGRFDNQNPCGLARGRIRKCG